MKKPEKTNPILMSNKPLKHYIRDILDVLKFAAILAGIFFLLTDASKSQTCKPTNLELSEWWTADGNTLGSRNRNNGTLMNGATFSTGIDGQAFSLDGVNDYISVTSSPTVDVGASGELTLETWVNPSNLNNEAVFEWDNGGSLGVHFWINARFCCPAPGWMYGALVDVNGNFHTFDSGGPVITTNTFQHIALTYDKSSGIARMYRNGIEVVQTNLGVFTPQTSSSYTLNIGSRPFRSDSFFGGLIDEPAIYDVALTAAEIQSIYDAGLAGKYKTITTSTGFASIEDFSKNNALASPSMVQTVIGDVTITFPSVTINGETQQIPLDLSLLPNLPTNFTATGLTYDISTTAIFTGSPTLCFNLPSFNDSLQFSRLKVFHLENGNWVDRTTTSDFATRTLCSQTSSLSPFTIVDNIAPTAANVSVSGRVLNANGRGISKARISVTDNSGNTRTVSSNQFGYYRFPEIVVGETYIITVRRKGYQFSPQVLYLTEELTSVNFVALE